MATLGLSVQLDLCVVLWYLLPTLLGVFLIKCVFLQEKKSATPPPNLRRAGSSVSSTEDAPNSTNSKAILHQRSQSSNPTFNCSTGLSVNLPGKLGILTKVSLFVLNSSTSYINKV